MSRLGTRARALRGLDATGSCAAFETCVGSALETSASASGDEGPPIMRDAALRTAPEGGPARSGCRIIGLNATCEHRD